MLIPAHSEESEQARIITFPSTWINGDGSILHIDSIEDGSDRIIGHYVNLAEGYPSRNLPYPVTGWLYGPIITFSTIWRHQEESCNAVTTWIGYIDEDKIITFRQLIDQDSEDLSKITEGIDNFK